MSNVVFNLDSLDTQNEIIRRLKNAGGGSTPVRYTVKIDKNNSDPYNRITYMDDAEGMTPAYMDFTNNTFNYGDWGDVWFIKDNYPVMLKYDGTVDYKLDPNDYTKKEDGTSSDVGNTSYNGNAMSRFPKVYLSFTEDTNYGYISVCETKYDENYEAIGFINDNGNEVNEIFLSIYEGSYVSGKLRSLSDYTIMVSETHTNEVSYAQSNGTGWYVGTWAQRQMVNALLTIISKSDNSQEAFGYGNYNASGKLSTGVLNYNGQFFGYSSSYNNAVKVFHIENWWGNIYKRIGGLVSYQDSVYAKMSGPYNTPGSTSTSGYTPVFTYSSNINGYTVNCKCSNTCGRLPISKTSPGGTSGSTSTFLCDGLYIRYRGYSGASYYYYPRVGGCYDSKLNAGASFLYLNGSYSSANSDSGAALSYMS